MRFLTSVYLEAYQTTHDSDFARVARETIDYVLSQMTGPDGAFFSTEDADSEGVEGKYYVWTVEEVTKILGEDRAKTFCYVYDVTTQGNWEDHNILNLPRTVSQAASLLERDVHLLRAELEIEPAPNYYLLENSAFPPARTPRSWSLGMA